MLTRVCMLALAGALLAVSPAGTADEKAPVDPSASVVRLKLIDTENAQLLEHYQVLVKRELGMHDSIRACIKSGSNRLPEYEQALKETRDDLDATKQKLVALEVEKRKLTGQLGKKDVPAAAGEPLDRANQTLEKILERLNSIEKRLEKMERPR